MHIYGTARLDRRTKDLVKRLERGDIAIIDHKDMDRLSAESLLESGVELVINASVSISGSYPNLGPLLLLRGGVEILDAVGPEIFDGIAEGDRIDVSRGEVYVGDEVIAHGTRLTIESVEKAMEEATGRLDEQLDAFVRNTMEYLDKERELLTGPVAVPHLSTRIDGRHALVVVRGYDYKDDLRTLIPYIRETKPVLIGVDGGADALMEAGFRSDIIIGDMDSVSDHALRKARDLIVHAYPDGRCPGRERIAGLGLSGTEWRSPGMSEDLALMLASELGAELIVAVGTHWNLMEQLDKGRKGAASTFLVRMRVGPLLVDAKGVSRLYRASVSPLQMIVLVGAGLALLSVVLFISVPARSFLNLILLQLRTLIGL
ncbi:MAG: putative cytokinetic ring protein SteA [Coriobacteriia bacterium]|nr:putative cytokinetic ring protein SteA [Coriobacteriia bacterium]